MPDLLSSEVPLYSSEYPYHFVYDNIPLEALKRRDEILSSSLDRNTLVLIDAQGTQGSLSNRLNQSIDEDCLKNWIHGETGLKHWSWQQKQEIKTISLSSL